ncbi:MAG: hypothetical protein PHS71_10790 [Proteiniphilum sp.]|nr:hypothetical protein [Proteiniphilum sp.]MDD3969201.1 hypothetical protein [Proteiniphilum sp.]MDD4801098.1 hypothetical protein [Proteiniphilum sp.]
MQITIEISYYALTGDYATPVKDFLERLSRCQMIQVETGSMSTLIAGEYHLVMQALTDTLAPLMVRYPSVFVLKISNACKVK